MTRICFSTQSLSASTWEMIPTSRPPCVRRCSAPIAWCSADSSSVPKPSSTNMASTRTPPETDWISSLRPSASESDAMNDSPPESDFTLRRVSL